MAESLKERMRRVEESKLHSMGDVGQRAAEAEAKVVEFQKDSVTKANHEAAIKAEQQAKANAEAEVQRLKNDAPKKADGTFYTKQEIDNHIATIAKKANGVPYSQQEVDALAIKDASGHVVDQAAYNVLVAAQANIPAASAAIKDASGHVVDQAAYNVLVAAQANIPAASAAIKDASGNPVDQAAYNVLVAAQANIPAASAAIKDASGNPVDQAAYNALVAQANIPAASAAIKDANGKAVDQGAYNTLVTGQKTDVENYKLQLFAFMETKANGVYPAHAVDVLRPQVCSGNAVSTQAKAAILDAVFDLEMFCEKSVAGQDFDPNNI